MCGIAGILSNKRSDHSGAVGAMIERMRHRGPDDRGIESFSEDMNYGYACLGHARLSIIDLSSGGHQPMRDDTRGIAVVYNGEIFNFQEIRRELSASGVAFKSDSDTEVLLESYGRWGEKCVDRFRGMFAFAVLDRKNKRVFIARDRLGIKPLYYYLDADNFVFASEVRAVLASGLIDKRLDPGGIASYLGFGGVTEPHTLIAGVRMLEAGHYAVLDRAGFSVKRYWNLLDTPASTDSRAEALAKTSALLDESVKLRLISDVPLGAFLSGGIDSSSIVALAKRSSNAPVRTVSIVFPEEDFSESVHSRGIARLFGTDHKEIEVSARYLLENLPRALQAMDQPTFDGINTFFVSKFTREAGLTVALSGLGGDELFGGYPSFRRAGRIRRISAFLSVIPEQARWVFVKAISGADERREMKMKSLLSRKLGETEIYFILRNLFTDTEISGFTGGRGARAGASHERQVETFNHISLLELTNYMKNILLKDTDSMSMAHALEVRVPLIDHKLVEYVWSLPASYKEGGEAKRFLLDALPEKLPKSATHRKKMGFTFPFEVWMKNELKAEIEGTLQSMKGSKAAEMVSMEAALRVWRDFLSGNEYWNKPWALYSLVKWCANNGI